MRGASARRHVEPGDSARGGGWKSLRPPCSPPAALSECRACCISRQSRSSSLSFFASPRSRQRSVPLNRQPTTASPPNVSPASTDCCSSTSTRTASPAPSALVLRDRPAGLRTRRSAGATRKPARRMTTDTIFRIASQTEGAHERRRSWRSMEEGKLALTRSGEPLHSRLREDDRRRAERYRRDARAGAASDHDSRSADAHRGNLVRHGRHVSALYEAKGLGPAAGYRLVHGRQGRAVCDTMDRLGTLPFVAQPGEAYVYGYNTDILGCVVERASGMPLDRVHPHADHRAARHEGHAVLPAG